MTAEADTPPEPTGTVDDWINNPAPPPRALGEPAHAPRKAPARPVAAAKPKPVLRPVDALADQLDDAPLAPGSVAPEPAPEPDSPAEAPPPDRGARRPHGEIWEDCPVRALGVLGSTQYLLDIHGQLRAVGKADIQAILSLFGNRQHLLWRRYPRFAKGSTTPIPQAFDQGRAASDIFAACADKGLFSPEGAVRGVGAWADDDGNLIYHAGDRLFFGTEARQTGDHQGRIYPAAPAIPHPEFGPADPAPDILATLDTWNWQRPDIDPMVTLGTIGCQMLGGALEWRPAIWTTGGPGTGKSALNRLIGWLHGGDRGLVATPDATARGIAALLGHSSLPVALDELEPGDTGSQKERQIVETARVASSGGRWVRGSSDQTGATGQLRSAFMFSSVLIPGILKSQDLQRMIVLNLDPFPASATPPAMRAETWRKRGAALKGVLIRRWPTWAKRLELWREAFALVKVTGRPADNWATTLAMAHMALSEALPTAEEMAGWTAKLAELIQNDTEDAGTDARDVLTLLMTKEFDVFRRGQRFMVSQWVMVAAGAPAAPPGLLGDFTTDPQGKAMRAKAANDHLASAGLRVIANGKDEPHLFVANDKIGGLLALFEGSQWAGGAWKQSISRIPGARPSTSVRTLAGIRTRGWEVPLSAISGLMDVPEATAPVIGQRGAPAPAAGADMPTGAGEFY